ncbi:MAG: hypothetical protein ABIR50_07445, partial [Ginsengibacter sp.]
DSYLSHVKEDMEVYRNLFSYVNPEIKKEGQLLLRKYKFPFYYTLMIKALMKGKIKTAYAFYKEMCLMDNFFKLSIAFIKNKAFKQKYPLFLNT